MHSILRLLLAGAHRAVEQGAVNDEVANCSTPLNNSGSIHSTVRGDRGWRTARRTLWTIY
jgi:hypothetical protein